MGVSGIVSKKDFVERRKQLRVKIKEGAFVEFHKPRLFNLGKPRIIKSFSIIDISVKGLAFQYVDRNMWSHDFNPLSISKSISKTDDKIGKVPFKAVSDFIVSRHANSILIKRCGVKFGKLTLAQKSQLVSFIRNHAISESLRF